MTTAVFGAFYVRRRCERLGADGSENLKVRGWLRVEGREVRNKRGGIKAVPYRRLCSW